MKKLIFLATVFIVSFANAGMKNQNQACGQNDGLFAAFPGSHTVKLKIGNREFLDKLNITSVHHQLGSLKAKFEGDFTVVGAFTARIGDGALQYGLWAGQYHLYFKITARENGQSFPVYFKAASEEAKDGACLLKGKAYSPTPDQEMGSFVMTKDSGDCVCPP